jgi:hypothetical protein
MTRRRLRTTSAHSSRNKSADPVGAPEAVKSDPGVRREDSLEGLEPTQQQDARALGDAVDRFRSLHPADWEQLRLCPLQHGLETMVRKLRAYR